MPLFIGIAGPSGGGKTTVSNEIREKLVKKNSEILLINLDDYYLSNDHLSFEERTKQNYDHPDSFEIDLLIKHLEELNQNKPVEMPEYDFVMHTRKKQTNTIYPTPIIIVEGILTFAYSELVKLLDIRIYVDSDSDVCFIRRLTRDTVERKRSMNSVINQYLETVKPMFDAYVEPSKKAAHVIIPNGEENHVAIDMVVDNIIKYRKKGEKNEK